MVSGLLTLDWESRSGIADQAHDSSTKASPVWNQEHDHAASVIRYHDPDLTARLKKLPVTYCVTEGPTGYMRL